jgi:hypothetical protein
VSGRNNIRYVPVAEGNALENTAIVLDLLDVTITDGDAATFFASCELKGTELKNCPAFLRGRVDQKRRALRNSSTQKLGTSIEAKSTLYS